MRIEAITLVMQQPHSEPRFGVRYARICSNGAMSIDEMAGCREVGDKYVCLNCVHSQVLKDLLSSWLEEEACSFCESVDPESQDARAAPLVILQEAIMEAINFCYSPVEQSDALYFEGEYIAVTLDYWEVLDNICGDDIEHAVMEEIADAFESWDWVEYSTLELSPDESLFSSWDEFCNTVKYRSRFLFGTWSEVSSGHPDERTTREMLGQIDRVIANNDLVKTVESGTQFLRGRLVDEHASQAEFAKPEALGSAPQIFASANRMSPDGISMFYGSLDVATVVAEIGIHGTKRFAMIGAFEVTRNLTVIDLTTIPEPTSLYLESGRTSQYYERRFLRRFASDLGKSVKLDGREHIGYVPTQVITEYFRLASDVKPDGILYRSVQNQGINCVLFFGYDSFLSPPENHSWGPEAGVLRLIPDSVQKVRIVASPQID
jgi:hypothetical protein